MLHTIKLATVKVVIKAIFYPIRTVKEIYVAIMIKIKTVLIVLVNTF